MNDDIDPVDPTADSYEEEYFGYEIYVEKIETDIEVDLNGSFAKTKTNLTLA